MAFVLLSLVSAALPPRTVSAGTVRRSFRGGYPSWVSEARRQSVSAGPTGASMSTRKAKSKAPNKLVGTAKCVEDSVIWITVVNSEGEHHVLLDKISAPSSKNPNARKMAVKFLHDLVDGKEVEVLWTKRKRGDIVGVVYFKHPQGMVEVNLTLVKNGCAKQSIYDRTAAYAAAEKDARLHKRGMWSAK